MNRGPARLLLVTLVPAALLLAIVLVIKMRFGVTTSVMTGDIACIAGLHPLTGFLSTLGVLLWAASASICFFAAAGVT